MTTTEKTLATELRKVQSRVESVNKKVRERIEELAALEREIARHKRDLRVAEQTFEEQFRKPLLRALRDAEHRYRLALLRVNK